MNWMLPVYIGLGGALGAVMRYGVMSLSGRIIGLGFPYGTMVVNIAGSLLMGLVIEYLARHPGGDNPELRAFIAIGFLGAFTTFSAFSLDVLTLYTRGEYIPAATYIFISVICSIAAVFGGLWIGKHIFS
jgi:CrcB protein